MATVALLLVVALPVAGVGAVRHDGEPSGCWVSGPLAVGHPDRRPGGDVVGTSFSTKCQARP